MFPVVAVWTGHKVPVARICDAHMTEAAQDLANAMAYTAQANFDVLAKEQVNIHSYLSTLP